MAAGVEVCKQNVASMLNQRDFFRPKQSVHSLHVIGNYADHLHLDKAFLRDSSEWRARQDPARINAFAKGATDAVAKVNSTLGLLQPGIPMAKAEGADNLLRSHEFASNQALRSAREVLHPYAQESHDRILQYCDMVGATNRYTTYRNNMTHNRRTFSLDTNWARESLPAAAGVYTANETLPFRQGERFSLPKFSNSCSTTNRRDCEKKRTVSAEPAGDTQWQTDFSINYTRKVKPPFGEPFPVNVSPDFSSYSRGRPLDSAPKMKKSSEYQDRYLPPREQINNRPRLGSRY